MDIRRLPNIDNDYYNLDTIVKSLYSKEIHNYPTMPPISGRSLQNADSVKKESNTTQQKN